MKLATKNVLKTIKYDLYLVLIGVLAFLSYIGYINDVLLPIYLVIGGAIYFLKIDKLYILPIVIFIQMAYSDSGELYEVNILFTVAFLVASILDTVIQKKPKKLGKLTIPLAILCGLSILTWINSPSFYIMIAGFFNIFIVLAAYLYAVNTFEKRNDNMMHMSKIFVYSSMLITAQMLYFISQSDLEVMYIIQRRLINLGWENINLVIYSNIISIPLAGYLIMKSKIKLPYMVFALVSVLGIMMTLSRSSLLSVGVFVVLLVPLIIIKEKNKMNLFIQGLLLLMFLSIAMFYLEQSSMVTDYYQSLLNRDLLHFNDRLAVLIVGKDTFLQHPIIGSGGLFSSRFYLEAAGNSALNYHNTIVQASTLGILGLIAFVYLFVEKARLFFYKKSDFKWFMVILVFVTAFVNGSLQPMYFYTMYMVFLFLIIAAYEVSEETAE